MRAFQTHKSKNTGKKAFARKASLLGTIGAAMILAGCFGAEFEKHQVPITASLIQEMDKINVNKRDAIFIRIFKKEAELEVWKKTSNGRYAPMKFALGQESLDQNLKKATDRLLKVSIKYHPLR